MLQYLQCYKMDNANLELQTLIARLRESINSTIEVCQRSQKERVNKLELFQALNTLENSTAKVAKGIKTYIEQSRNDEINNDILKESTQLQLEAQNTILALNSVLQFHHQDSDTDLI